MPYYEIPIIPPVRKAEMCFDSLHVGITNLKGVCVCCVRESEREGKTSDRNHNTKGTLPLLQSVTGEGR